MDQSWIDLLKINARQIASPEKGWIVSLKKPVRRFWNSRSDKSPELEYYEIRSVKELVDETDDVEVLQKAFLLVEGSIKSAEDHSRPWVLLILSTIASKTTDPELLDKISCIAFEAATRNNTEDERTAALCCLTTLTEKTEDAQFHARAFDVAKLNASLNLWGFIALFGSLAGKAKAEEIREYSFNVIERNTRNKHYLWRWDAQRALARYVGYEETRDPQKLERVFAVAQKILTQNALKKNTFMGDDSTYLLLALQSLAKKVDDPHRLEEIIETAHLFKRNEDESVSQTAELVISATYSAMTNLSLKGSKRPSGTPSQTQPSSAAATP